jgi:LCP family protein required for cell wall assembly
MGYHGHFEEEKHKPPKKKAGKIVLAIALILVLLVGAGVLWGIRYYNRMFSKMNIVTLDENLYETFVPETTEPSLPAETETPVQTTEVTEETVTEETTIPPFKAEDIVNILVVGQASRAGEEGHMADSTILVTVNTYDGTVKLSSVLRDTLVDLPAYKGHGVGRNKFNMAYQLGHTYDGIEGAMAYTNLTMFHNFGVEVDHNVEISFESFTKLIDYMGGIEIELTEAEAKYLNNDDLYVKYDVQPGLQYLDGMAALSYARMRKAEGDADSDIKRTSRQHTVIGALFNKVRYLSLTELQGVADTLLPLITTTMNPKDEADLMLKMLPHVRELKYEKGSNPIQTTY